MKAFFLNLKSCSSFTLRAFLMWQYWAYTSFIAHLDIRTGRAVWGNSVSICDPQPRGLCHTLFPTSYEPDEAREVLTSTWTSKIAICFKYLSIYFIMVSLLHFSLHAGNKSSNHLIWVYRTILPVGACFYLIFVTFSL